MAYRTQEDRKIEKLQPPQSVETERSLLGAILKDSGALNEVVDILDDEAAFYSPKHRVLYRGILNLYGRHEPADITTVVAHLSDNKQLEKVGGRLYLVELVEDVASTANVTKYADIVLEKYLLRRLIETSNEIARSCYSSEDTVDSLLNSAESNIFLLSEKRFRKGFSSIKDLLPTTFEEIDRLQTDDSSLVGIKSGFDKFDEMTNGLHKGDLVIVAGRPSMGKSAFAMNLAEHVAINLKKAVGVFSIEMSKEQLALRMLCGRARISQQRLRARKLRDEEWANLTIAGGPLQEAPIYIDDSPTLTSLDMMAKARRLKAQLAEGAHPLGLLVVDYLQMMHASGRFENRQQEMASISRAMKIVAKELEVPVIACSQLSRLVEQRGGDKRPQLSDLRESGAIEQDADVVAFIYRAEHYMAHVEKNEPKYQEVEGKAEVIIAKQRNGPTGIVHLTFLKEYARFENQAPQHREIPPGVDPVSGGDTPF